MYELGKGGGSKNLYKAVREYQKAADQGHPLAQHSLGWIYAKGKGVPQDMQKAMHYFEQAIQGGDTAAYNGVGYVYEQEGKLPQAYEAYQKAAAGGDLDGKYNQARLLQSGKGVKRDVALAQQLYQEAAQEGHQQSKQVLQSTDLQES
ncbi:MAG: sel1 repeat family protein [Verrucomicrobia bacterium]|nr:sel1 repeat family protein [Verrucomicrobiota bacterium]